MIMLSKMAYEALREEGSANISRKPSDWWKKSKWATIWTIIVLAFEIPITIIKYVIMAICFIPHKIYEELEY